MKPILITIAVCFLGATYDVAQPAYLPEKLNPYHHVVVAYSRAFDFLVKSQNQDGSWGKGTQIYTTTALAFAAFTKNGRTNDCRTNIVAAFEWLLAAKPESIDDKIAIAAVLDDYSGGRTSSFQRIETILQSTGTTNDSVWSDFLSVNATTENVHRPKWSPTPSQVIQKHSAAIGKVSPRTKDDYLENYIVHQGRRDAWRSGYLSAITKLQQDDGSLPTTATEDKIAATALYLLSLTELNIPGHPSYPSPPPVETHDDEVNINVK